MQFEIVRGTDNANQLAGEVRIAPTIALSI